MIGNRYHLAEERTNLHLIEDLDLMTIEETSMCLTEHLIHIVDPRLDKKEKAFGEVHQVLIEIAENLAMVVQALVPLQMYQETVV
jgi:kynureninase